MAFYYLKNAFLCLKTLNASEDSNGNEAAAAIIMLLMSTKTDKTRKCWESSTSARPPVVAEQTIMDGKITKRYRLIQLKSQTRQCDDMT